MAEAEREGLRNYVEVVRSYRASRHPVAVEAAFANLTLFDQAENADLWEELRQALAACEALQDPEALALLAVEEEARAGHWWYDPDAWRAAVAD